MTDIAANGQPVSDNTNRSRATYYNCGQVAEDDTFQGNKYIFRIEEVLVYLFMKNC